MKPLTCEMCGSPDVVKQNGLFVCQHCGTKYTVEDAKKMMIEGAVKIDNSEKLSNLYQLARRAKLEGNIDNAAKYYGMILLDDPNNWEATFFSALYTAMQTPIAEIPSAAYQIAGAATTAFFLISVNIKDREEIRKAAIDIALQISHVSSTMFSATMSHFKKFSNVPGANREKIERVNAIINMLFLSGNAIEKMFEEDKELCANTACQCWEVAFACYQSCFMPMPEHGAEYIERIKKYNPDFTIEKPNNNNGGCYVATAVYGSYDCPEVWTLRRFRDNVMAKSWFGRAFIHFYYSVSPTLVRWFGKRKWFQAFWRFNLDAMIERLHEKGIESTPYEDIQW